MGHAMWESPPRAPPTPMALLHQQSPPPPTEYYLPPRWLLPVFGGDAVMVLETFERERERRGAVAVEVVNSPLPESKEKESFHLSGSQGRVTNHQLAASPPSPFCFPPRPSNLSPPSSSYPAVKLRSIFRARPREAEVHKRAANKKRLREERSWSRSSCVLESSQRFSPPSRLSAGELLASPRIRGQGTKEDWLFFGQLEMYSGQQSDQGPAANSGKEFLEGNWGSVAMHQKMGYSSGTYGFQDYSMAFEEKPGMCRSSTGTFSQNIQMSDEHSGGVKKRKGTDDCIALLNPSASSSMQNVGDQQTEVSSQIERNSVEEDKRKISPRTQSKEGSSDGDGTKDYVHMRAKRGQATNSHSLAERMRRKKISERMKLLQDLVPGCSKITGKAVMLDEIINYVQSLQRQVEFLSMKLATVNPELGFDIEQILSKQVNSL
uniref:Uncharacterized protein n=1 Tax=Avena sativa TaxID=4498 RepID=A0ACD6A4K9_AVESA